MKPKGWHSRGFLPHFDGGEIPQFLTWRLADSLPQSKIFEIQRSAGGLPEPDQKRQIYRQIEQYLDSGIGSCILKNPLHAAIVQNALIFDHGRRFVLHHWVVMPNHVHVLLTPMKDVALSEILRVLKSLSAHRMNKIAGTTGMIWQPDYFDRAIRDIDHFYRVAEYIEWNPVKAKLCSDPSRFGFSSGNPGVYRRLDRFCDPNLKDE